MRAILRNRKVVWALIAVLSILPLAVAYGQAAGASATGSAAEESTWLGRIFSSNYMPRQMCMRWETDVIWTHVISDSIIALAYYSIPVALLYFVRKRKDVVFSPIFYCFALFILACGTTHIFSVIAIWHPYYRLDGIVKAITAGLSILTAALLWKLMPQAMQLTGPAQLRAANELLQGEVAERTRAENELRALTTDLEGRVRDRTGELEQINLQLRSEVAARESAHAEVERASRTKDEFLATLSHELRTPMNAILGWTQLLRAGKGIAGDDYTQGLEIIERNTRVQVQLIEDLLDMSRIVSGKVRLDVQAVDLAAVIEAAVETVRPAADAKEIKIQKVIDPLTGGGVMGDPNRLQQVIWNLLSNAVKFTPKGGRVQVHLERVNSHVEVVVSDTGQGITPAFLPFVFDRFRQEDASSSRRHGGLGLGLAIVRHLVELHGGSVRVKSEGEGKGATFFVALPRSAVHEDRTAEEKVHPLAERGLTELVGPSLTGVSVLVVDDEADARELLKRVLEGCGAKVLLASTAREALTLLKQERPTVIVSDIGMPDEDGYKLIQRVRALDASDGGLTPALALTAFARAEDRRRVLLSGFQMHLAKPAEANELLASVANLAGLIMKG